MNAAKRERLGAECYAVIQSGWTNWNELQDWEKERYRAAAEKLYAQGYDAAVLGVEC